MAVQFSNYVHSNITLPKMAHKTSETEKKAETLSAAEMKKIETTARDFEAVFISEMIKPMFNGLETDTMFGGGQAEEMFRSIMVQEYGKNMAQTGSIGIADHVKAHLINIQAEQHQQHAKSEN